MGDTTPSIAAQVVALTHLNINELREKWREVFGEETVQRHRQYLIRRIAWGLQRQHYGHELSDEAKVRLDELQQQFRDSPPETWFRGARHNRPTTKTTPVRDAKAPKVGTTLVRDYKGTRITVTAVEGGFMYNNEFFKSLSAVARAITGSHMSGVAFFKPKKEPPR